MARSFRRNCRGQVIVVTALLVAVILLSTAMYVIEIKKETPIVQSNDGVPIDSYRNSVKSTLVSALANISGGGSSNILLSDLAALKTVIASHSYESQLSMDYTLLNSGGYSNGVHLSWGSSGYGVSSAYATISCSASNSLGSSQVNYSVNVTSSLQVSGDYMLLNETHKEVNLTIRVFDESGAALADHFTISYHNETSWSNADSPSIVSLGDGSYNVTFYALTGQSGESLDISSVCVTTRGISVSAALTCNNSAGAPIHQYLKENPTVTNTNYAPMFQGGTCDWGSYNEYGYFYPDQGADYSYLAQRDSTVQHNGHDSIRIDGQGIPNSIYNRPEIDHPWITAHAGDHVYYAYWVKTASSEIGAGAIIGMDAYGSDGVNVQRLFEVHAGGTFTYPYTGTPDYLPYGSDWTHLVLDFVVPDTYYTKTDTGATVNPSQIVGFYPFLGCSWNSGELASIWFADAEFYINPSSSGIAVPVAVYSLNMMRR
jgi:hypothetical protein